MKPRELKPEFYPLDFANDGFYTPQQMSEALGSAMVEAIKFAEYRGPTPDYYAWLARIEELREGK